LEVKIFFKKVDVASNIIKDVCLAEYNFNHTTKKSKISNSHFFADLKGNINFFAAAQKIFV